MKKILLLLLCLVTAAGIQADPITRQQAQQKANAFLQKRKDTRQLKAVVNHQKLAPRRNTVTTNDPYYVFNRGEQEGFVIVSGDDKTCDILGYCDSGEFDYNNAPDAMKGLLNDYAAQIEYIQTHPDIPVYDAVPIHPAVPQLMSSKWNQGYPYNLQCPNYFGQGTSVTGCVATAMAQVMYYQRDKSVTETLADIPAYNGTTAYTTGATLHVEGIPVGSPIDWANMRDTYSGSETDAQRLAVANLMHYCGVSVQMDYTNRSSGAYSYRVAEALKAYFGYGSSVQYISRNSYTDTGWDEIIYNEVSNGRPLYLSGANSEAGHAFVCDGYDGERRYHINWGWGGSSDGFYLLNNLTPGSQGIGGSNDGYNSGQEAIIGMEPEDYENKTMAFENAAVRQLCIQNWDANSDGRISFGEAAAVTDLGTVFKGKTNITSFPELRMFKGITTIPDEAFDGCTALTQVTLPQGITTIGARAFRDCRALNVFNFPKEAVTIGEEAFSGCKLLKGISLSEELTTIQPSTFKNCSALSSIDIPASVTAIGNGAFAGCQKLTKVQLHTNTPASIAMGSGVFTGVDLSKASLTVNEGGKALFSEAEQWKEFATILEIRTKPVPVPSELVTDRTLYIYNVGTGKFLTRGEAYGTQAVVGVNAMRFKLKRNSNMAANTYYLVSEEMSLNYQSVFRTNADAKVGNGVKAVFVDGPETNNAVWLVKQVGENTYTFQPPTNSADYAKGLCLGVDPNHKSDYTSPTYGVYYDVADDGTNENCHWQFIDYENVYGKYEVANELYNLLNLAPSYIDTEREQNIYFDSNSTKEQLRMATRLLRKKLNYLDFEDNEVKNICQSSWDLDGNGELSLTEASYVTDLRYNFYNSAIGTFNELEQFKNLQVLYGNSFEGCNKLQTIKLPESLTTIYYRAFFGCSSLTEIELPEAVNYIDSNVFTGATSLKTVILNNDDPATIETNATAFNGLTLANMTLVVPIGSKERYSTADVWKKFGNIVEARGKMKPAYSELAPGKQYYIYHPASKKYVNKGEAYGTQGVVGTTGILYTAKHTNAMGEGIYYFSSAASDNGSVIFRTSSDSKVGDGVKAVFVDGSAGSSANWHVAAQDNNLYTIQVPANDANYTEGEFLGVLSSHESEVASPTFGLYWDINISTYPAQCQWAFISAEDMDYANLYNESLKKLKNMLATAKQRNIDVADEETVYNNQASTLQQLRNAVLSVSSKLGFIVFVDEEAKNVSLNKWDMDGDDELSQEEVANVETIGTTYRYNNKIVSLDELKHFSAITSLPEEAFSGCSSMVSMVVPSGVATIEANALKNCSKLKYMALLYEGEAPVQIASQTLPRSLTLFVPAGMVEKYKADEFWGKFTIEEYTGIPTVTANSVTRLYGRNINTKGYTVKGAPVNGEPVITCDYNEQTTPVGDHPINVAPGTITTLGLVCVNGVLTITPAALTITAKSYERDFGTENPEFEVTYTGFRNRETSEVLLKQPVVECDATINSPVGDYEIRVSGAEAQNYEMTYVAGTLTVKATDGIGELRKQKAEGSTQNIYDLQGRRMNATSLSELPTGVYVVNGKKVVK